MSYGVAPQPFFFVLRAVRHPCYVICADGGANRLYDLTKNQGQESTELPNTIIGDLDSLNPTVRKHYEMLGVTILEDPDQYSTDFTKCLKYLNTHASEIIASPRRSQDSQSSSSSHSVLEIVILGGLGGRVDQAFSQIHHLYMMTKTQREIREAHRISETNTHSSNSAIGGSLYLVSEESITFVLHQGRNIIHTPATRRADTDQATSGIGSQHETSKNTEEAKYFFEENVGIIPLSAPASITTQGFEWDVQNWHTEIGGQISTSNHIRAEKVEVETSVPVLFTVELAQRLKR
ncbi:hypothetical protein N7520_007203 [Penicillium odoratum]|uniref:uncharacterized protein n=1 Tax=Penicillium odoratum TaxID=1167516 RepID=UPI002546B6A2|nr:uncharacterized protein N7520_007203 [Penicillium odoratum]KAJ5760047.1 hypothetical protein N7520_007203 [Penicillium odoratum]